MHRTLAIISPSVAFGEFLSEGLVQHGYQCASFVEPKSLSTFLKLTPVRIVILHYRGVASSSTSLIAKLRGTKVAFPYFRTILLAPVIPEFRKPLLSMGADGVVTRPYGVTEVLSEIHRQEQALKCRLPVQNAPKTLPRPRRRHNVVSLFGRGPDLNT